MGICNWEYQSGTPVFIYGNIVEKDVTGNFAIDVFSTLRIDLDGLFNPFPDVNTAFFTKFRSNISITSYDDSAIKQYSGIPQRRQFGGYGYEFVDFVSFTDFISYEKQTTIPAFTWITSDYPPDTLLPFNQCTGSSGDYTVANTLWAVASAANLWATEAFYSFNESVVADIELIFTCQQTFKYYTSGTSPYGLYVPI